MDNISDKIKTLYNKNNNISCEMMKELEKESEKTNEIYSYLDNFIAMFDNKNSYIRTRGMVLFAVNARWDTDNKVNKNIDKYLEHITDEKPITSRQCIKYIPYIVKYKKELQPIIEKALKNADVTIYADTMRNLIKKDIKDVLEEYFCS